MKTTLRMLAALPAITLGVLAFGGALAPAAEAAGNGTWTTPTAGSTVSGSAVGLQFSTSDSTVTFTLPSGSGTVTQTATVSGGVATGTFDSTKAVNGSATLVANECNVLNMCDQVAVSITVANAAATAPSAPAPPPSLSPAGGDLAEGAVITVEGGYTAMVTITVAGQTVVSGTESLPFSYPVPVEPQGSYSISATVVQGTSGVPIGADGSSSPSPEPGGYAQASYTLVVPDTTPPVISKLAYPTSYFPVRDGFLDHFYAVFSVNEASTATLVMSKGGKVVSSGTLPVKNTALIDLRAGDKLKAGTYQWQLIVTDLAGNVTRTPLRSVKADSRHLIGHRATLSISGAASPGKTFANGCGSFRKAGGALTINGSNCTNGAAAANFFPRLKQAIDYSGITVTIHSTGAGQLTYINFSTGAFANVVSLRSGTTTLKLSDLDVGYPAEFLVEVIAAPGKTVTVSSISAVYTYKTLSKS